VNRFMTLLVIVLFVGISFNLKIIPNAKATDATHPITMTTSVIEYILLDVSGPAADTVAFGNLTPGTPICYNTGTVATVSTNAGNGYTLGIHDSHAASSSLAHTDTTTHIPKMTNGTIGTPVAWGTNYGVGTSMYAATTTKEGTWGTGTTVCDANNLYAAIPETATTAHTAAGAPMTNDTSSWSYKIDVQNTQKIGDYSGTMTFTATAVLS